MDQSSETASTLLYPSQTPGTINAPSCHPDVEQNGRIMGVTVNSLSSTRTQAGAEYVLLDSCAQLHACPSKYPGQRVRLLDPGIHTTSGVRLRYDGGRLVTFKLSEGRTVRVILSLGCLTQQEYWSDLRAARRTLFFPDKIKTPHSQTQLHKEDSMFIVKEGC